MDKNQEKLTSGRPLSPPDNVGAWPLHWAKTRPDAFAVSDGERELDWKAFDGRISVLASRFRSAGVGSKGRIAVLLHNRTAYLEAFFAAARIGAILVPINLRLSEREIAFQFDDCRPHLLLYEKELEKLVSAAFGFARHSPSQVWAVSGEVSDDYERALRTGERFEAWEDVSGDHPVLLMYTSGTTGKPKGALLPHRKVLANALNAASFFDNGTKDRVLIVTPLFHSLGLQILALPTIHAGGGLILQKKFEPAAVWDAVDAESITYFGGVPSMHQRLNDSLRETLPHRWKRSALRFVFTAGSAVSIELIRDFKDHGILLQQGYGQTETSTLTCLSAGESLERAGTVGRPVKLSEVKVVDRAGGFRSPSLWRETEPGEKGEIVVQGPVTMLGYWENPEATAETLIAGWLCTGDLATRDEDGFITLVGRTTDMFISGGENVYPAEIEAIYREHPAIREIALVGEAHPQWGEVGRAHLVFESGQFLSKEELDAWAADRLARFKCPKRYVVERELPRTASGKIQKHRLKSPEQAGGPGKSSSVAGD